jgi:hypothetical protein
VSPGKSGGGPRHRDRPTAANAAAKRIVHVDRGTSWVDLARTSRARDLAARQRGLDRALAEARLRRDREAVALIVQWRAETVRERQALREAS